MVLALVVFAASVFGAIFVIKAGYTCGDQETCLDPLWDGRLFPRLVALTVGTLVGLVLSYLSVRLDTSAKGRE